MLNHNNYSVFGGTKERDLSITNLLRNEPL
jgi:hypothetical protein